MHTDWLTPDERLQQRNKDINNEVTRRINEQRGNRERDKASTRHAWYRQDVQDTLVLEEDNEDITGAMHSELEEEKIDIILTPHKARPRRSGRVAGRQPQYSGLICDEDMLLQDICFLYSIDMQDNDRNFSPSHA